jgi:transcriptional regulator with XRE-family HTH domain
VVFIDVKLEVAIPILLKQSRIEQGLSQGEIAEKIKAPFQTVQKLEKIGGNSTIRTLQKIGKALGKRVVIDLV